MSRKNRNNHSAKGVIPKYPSFLPKYGEQAWNQYFSTPSETKPIKRGLRSLENTLGLTYVKSNPAYQLIQDIGNKAKEKIINKLTGSKFGSWLVSSTRDEADFTDDQLKIIDDQVRYRAKSLKNVNPQYFLTHPGDTITTVLNADSVYHWMYGRPYAPNSGLKEKITTPLGQVESTLGDYTIKYFGNGYKVQDIYDFNEGQGNYRDKTTPYYALRMIAQKYGHKNTDDDKGKTKTVITRKINHW